MSDGPPIAGPTPAGPAPEAVVVIRCREHGPLVVELPAAAEGQTVSLRVTDHRGGDFPLPDRKRLVALCRCGQTRTRPFCDGSPRNCGCEAADLAPGAERP